MHREEVRKLLQKTQIKGHTLIPTQLYFRNGRVKCELALAKGTKLEIILDRPLYVNRF